MFFLKIEYVILYELQSQMDSPTLTSADYDYQFNIYYGIFFPEHMFQQVYGLVGTYPEFKELDADPATATIGKVTLMATTNTDRENAAAHAMIYVEKMVIGGPDSDNPSDTFMHINPTAMIASMEKNKPAVEIITRLYKWIVRDLKTRGEDVSELNLGWTCINCTFMNDSSSESVEEVKKPAKIPKKKAEPAAKKVSPTLAAPVTKAEPPKKKAVKK